MQFRTLAFEGQECILIVSRVFVVETVGVMPTAAEAIVSRGTQTLTVGDTLYPSLPNMARRFFLSTTRQ